MRQVALEESPDAAIWEYAKKGNFVIVSKDSDFQQRSLLFGHPPKFVWLRVGNCSAALIQNLLRKYSVAIHTFEQSAQKSHLMIL